VKLTEKDKEFLERLAREVLTGRLRVDLVRSGPARLALRKNYGDRVESVFGMTRQGIRWRFERLADMYVSAYETILLVESELGAELRSLALEVARDRADARRKARQLARTGSFRRQRRDPEPDRAQEE